MIKTITLNLPYDLPDEKWDQVQKVYESMNEWKGFITDGCPTWYGTESENQFIWASVEPSGLLITGQISDDLWTGWLTVLCAKLSIALNMEIHDAEM